MEKIITVDNIADYDRMIGAETLHPLVNVVDFSRLPSLRHIGVRRLYGYYAIYLKGAGHTTLRYGRSVYDYREGALVFVAPGQVVGSEDDGNSYKMSHRVLMFHPDLLKGTYLLPMMKRYSYFSYDVSEALYPTEAEKQLFITHLNAIEAELRADGPHKMDIVIDYIKLLLDYCSRFYDRQFETLHKENSDLLARFEQLMDSYFQEGESRKNGLLTVQYCADRLCLSPHYFSDIIRKETGISPLKHIHRKTLDVSKALLVGTSDSVAQISEAVGFQYPQHFSKWFKRAEGCTPNAYRNPEVR